MGFTAPVDRKGTEVLSCLHLRIAPDPRKKHMELAAEWIDHHPGPSGSIAVVEVGFLGWATERPVLDLLGLISPGALDAVKNGRTAEFFLDERPAYFVFNTNFLYIFGDLLGSSAFLERYELVHTIPATRRHVVPVQIWQRRGPPGKKHSAKPNQELAGKRSTVDLGESRRDDYCPLDSGAVRRYDR